MKAIYYFRLIAACSLLSSFSFVSFGQSSILNPKSSFYLPFSEDWHFGNFTSNLWQTGSDNWKIDSQNGNEKPSVKFNRTGVLNNYSSSLLSNTIDAQNIKVGHIYLKFDLKLDDYNNNGSEYLKIMVSDSTGWHSIDSVSNTGSFDWEAHTYDIRDYSLGQVFQFKFEATGENSINILDWFIDNIEVYRECDAPEDLVANIVWAGDFPANQISWTAPNNMVEKELWKHWDTGSNDYGLEPICDQCNIEVAARWTPPMLEELYDDTIESIKFYSQSNYSSDVIIKVRNGENGSTVIYQDTISNIIGNTWTTHTLSQPVVIQAQTELWISYEVPYSDLGIFSFGSDNGPGMGGFSDLIKYSTDGAWSTLSSFGMDYNWNLQFSVVSEPVFDTSELLGFNVYRKWMRSNIYEQIRFVEFPIDNNWYFIEDTCFNQPCDAYYKVNAVWANEGDTCLSNYGRSYDFPMQDYVYILYEGMEDEEPLNKVSIYPNPTYNQLNIKSENKLQRIIIYNAFGQIVKSYNEMNSSKLTIDISNLEKGIYLLKAATKDKIIVKKFIKQ